MRLLGRTILLLLAGALVIASLPPGFDEDRSVAGFCSPDCLLQQDATHSVEPTPEPMNVSTALAPLARTDAPDTPRAPPHA